MILNSLGLLKTSLIVNQAEGTLNYEIFLGNLSVSFPLLELTKVNLPWLQTTLKQMKVRFPLIGVSILIKLNDTMLIHQITVHLMLFRLMSFCLQCQFAYYVSLPDVGLLTVPVHLTNACFPLTNDAGHVFPS